MSVHPNVRQAWETMVGRVQSEGTTYRDQYGRACRELRDKMVTIENADDVGSVVTGLRRQLPWLYPSAEELRGILFTAGPVTYEYTYAQRLFGTPNQVDGFLIPLLKEHPETRRAVALLYDPSIDSDPHARNVPVVLSIQVRLVHGLELTATLRSVDAFLGLPANALQLRALQEYIAERLSAPLGRLTLVCTSLHLVDETVVSAPAVFSALGKPRIEVPPRLERFDQNRKKAL